MEKSAVPPMVDVLNYIYKQAHYWRRRLPERSIFEVEDLVNEAVLLYYDLVEKYDPEKGVKFLTFLGCCLRNRFRKICYLETRHQASQLPLLSERAEEGDVVEEYNFPAAPFLDAAFFSLVPELSSTAVCYLELMLRPVGELVHRSTERAQVRRALFLEPAEVRELEREIQTKLIGAV